MDITPQPPAPNPPGKPKSAASGNKKPRNKRTEAQSTALVATPAPQSQSGSESSVRTAAPPESIESSLMEEDISGMIATAAYYLAERRNFAPGHELDDWLEAEQQLRK